MNYSTPIIDGYNEIVGPTNNLPLDDIQAHPENYLDYAYAPGYRIPQGMHSGI